jgi:DnaK suppressor protein
MATMPRRTDIDFEEFRKRLLKERNRLKALHQQLRAEMREEAEDAAENELSPVPSFSSSENEDTAALSADYDRDFVADQNERQLLHEVEKALERLDEGTYGLDEISGEPIPVERLRALPWARMTVENASRVD